MAKKTPRVLTLALQAVYLAAGGNQCPFCQSKDVSAGSFEADGKSAFNEVSCGACGESWLDVYALTGIDQAKHSTFILAPAEVIHVKAEFSDGTDQTCDVPDYQTAGYEIAETVTGHNFAITIDKVTVVDEKDNLLQELQATWTLKLSVAE